MKGKKVRTLPPPKKGEKKKKKNKHTNENKKTRQVKHINTIETLGIHYKTLWDMEVTG